MTARELLAEITGRGLVLESDGVDLRLVGPRDRMDPDLVARIRADKPGLLRALAEATDALVGTEPTLLQRSYLLGRHGVLGQADVASHVYHEFVGSWDLPRLEQALNDVIARHDSLRTRFTAAGRRVVEPAARLRIAVTDLRHLAPEAREHTLRRLRSERSHRVLPVDRAPLIAVEASIVDDTHSVLQVSHDGLAMDGISMFLFFRAWQHSYQQRAPAEDGAFPSFDAYLEALERSRDSAPARRSRAHWLDRLDDLPPHPELPLRADPASLAEARFTPREVRLAADQWSALRQRARDEGVTPTVVLLLAYAETLSYWGADRRMTINTTLANRPPIHPGMIRSIGQYSDVLLVAVDLDPEFDLRARARALHARLRRDLDNRHWSGLEVLRELQRRGDGQAARTPYTFNSTLGYPDAEANGSALSAFGREVYCVSQTPQVWLNVFAMEQDGELVVQLDAVDELFPPGLLDALTEGYHRMLERLLDEAAWAAHTVDLLPAQQRLRRREVNATTAALPARPAHEQFLRMAAAQPDAPAVRTSTATLSYGELARRAIHIASWLRERGVGRDELVGLVMRRGPEQIVGILATAISGAAYLPVDAELPAQRREYLLRDGRVRCVLTNVPASVPASIPHDVPNDVPAEVLNDEADHAALGRHTLRIDLTRPAPEDPAVPTPLPGWTPADLLYVLYTSGTTGEPKGVMVSHRSVLNLVTDCTKRFAITPSDTFFGISAVNFDLSVFDVFGALSAGAALVLPDHDRAIDPGHWLQLCDRYGVTIWNSVPAIVAMLGDQATLDGPAPLARLRLIMMSGDRIPPALPVSLRALLPGTALVSLGGPTETTVWNILYPITDLGSGRDAIPYGKPNSNNRCHVLDDEGRERPDWVIGEICGAGAGLARGYWGDPARTADRFFDHAGLGERIYRTGDLGHYLPDGNVMILGRKDFQIKINGYRIEAGEVETRLAQLPGVQQAAVVRQDSAIGARLVAHLAGAAQRRPTEADIRAALRRTLPEYMVPSVYCWHERLPLTRNGKVDRAALTSAAPVGGPPDPGDRAADSGVGVGSGSGVGPDGVRAAQPLEADLAELWSTVLRTEVTDVTQSFFDLGGDSLAAARVLAAVRKRFGTAIPLDQFYLVDTVRTLAAQITEEQLTEGQLTEGTSMGHGRKLVQR